MRNKLKVWLIVSTSIFGMLAIFSLPMIMMSPMMFDAPGSTTNVATNTIFYSLLSFPLVVVFTIILEWVLFRFNKLKGSLIVSFLPFLNMFSFIAGLFLW